MDTPFMLDGETRVLAIIGDPIGQVKSPAGVTASLVEAGRNAVLVPFHVSAEQLDAFVAGISAAQNFDGIIVTVPHKFAMLHHCATLSERARFLQTVNTMRRNPDGSWHGDMFDGEGFLAGIRGNGAKVEGARALMVGAGGAGTAIALALLEAGVAELAIHDGDAQRRDSLVSRLAERFGAKVHPGSANPAGFNLVINASPCGMRGDDPLPIDVVRLSATAFVGDVITRPAVTPLIAHARELGCGTQVGAGMFNGVRQLMIAFLLEDGPLSRPVRAAE
jgi:shikimate dehydrogenase